MRLTATLILATLIIAGLWACSDDPQIPPAAPEEPLEFIDSVIPGDGARNVALTSAVQVTFLRPMDTASLTANKFFLNGGGGYTFTRDSMRATLYPFGNLRPDFQYEAIVRHGVCDRDGNVMPSDYAWSFRTAFGTDLIDCVYPPSGAENAPVNSSLYVVFDHRMDETTFDGSTFIMLGGVAGQVSYSNDTAWFVPDAELAYDREYMAVLDGSIADTAGVSLGQSFSWSFTTTSDDSVSPKVVSVYPADGAGDVPLDTDIKISFSENVNTSPPSNWTLTVSDGLTGLVESVSRDIVLQPNSQLEYNHTYTVTFAGTIYDYYGNSLDTTVTWSFTTSVWVIMPLAIGNKWVYQMSWNTPHPIDSVVIVDTQYYDDELWYVDNRGCRHKNYTDRFVTNNSFEAPIGLITVPYPDTTYTGISIIIRRTVHPYRYDFYFQPNVGLVMLKMYMDGGSNTWDYIGTRRLIRMELQEP